MADTVAFILLAVIMYTLLGMACAWVVRLLYAEGEIRTLKAKARWLLLCIVWPILPVILVFWVVGRLVFWIWESLADLLRDAQLVKRD